jgi:tetratricopeptide (TPR) repeat protein
MKARAKQWFVVAVLVAVAWWLAAPAGAEPIGVEAISGVDNLEKQQELQDAIARFRERRWDDALKLLESACKKNPDLPPAQILMAELFARANIPGGARNSLERAVLAVPEDPQAYVILGLSNLREGRVTEADLLLTKANELLKTFAGSAKRKEQMEPAVLNGLAAVEEARERWDKAHALLEKWLRLEPKNANIMLRLARVLFQQKKAPEAFEMLRKAKAEDRNVLTPEAQLALLYEAYPDHENAKKWMAEALKVAGNDLRTRLVAGQWGLETGQLTYAKEQASKAVQLDPNSIEARILRGNVALLQRDYKDAEIYYESVVLKHPDNFAATNNLALALVEQDEEAKKRRGLAYAEQNVRAQDRLSEAWSTYGWALYKNKRVEEAERALRRAATAGQISPDTAYYLARVLVDQNKEIPEARRLLRAALESRRPFYLREEAQSLLDQLGK